MFGFVFRLERRAASRGVVGFFPPTRLLVDGRRRRRRDFERRGTPSTTTGVSRCCGRARGGVHGGHTSAACTRSLGTTSPAPVGPGAALVLAQTSHGARRQFRGWCSNRAARRQAGARQPRSGSWKAPQARMCASSKEGLLARRERAAARVPA